ncbi:helix-hairpin-helix domain-containing protein [Candidatus Daviesbacteria bacterium]|nr:helix-hairpin-helix domain-containing protein [Candidatus Daviesbacteria bacterium]
MDSLSWREKLEQYKIPIALSMLGLVLIIGGVFSSGLSNQKPNPPAGGFPKESLVEGQKLISVDVSGAVGKPGVYQLKEGSRIEDAILSAGGFSPDSNKEYISKYFNMAQKLSDGSKVYVPFEGEQTGGSGSSGVVAGTQTSSKVNINTASQAELEALPGIGPVTASKILSDRPYQAVEDLLSKKVLSKPVFEKIKEQLVVY